MERQRRQFLVASGAGALAGLATTRGATAPASTNRLTLTPQVTEGPFYFDAGLKRADITEGRKGVPLDVGIRVVDVDGAPLSGSRVDLWHCDAEGQYSGYAGQGPARAVDTRGRSFLRGTVLADDDGLALFHTIYPGWYAGRTTHIHLKVFNGRQVVLTSQLFLPDALSEYLFTNVSAYQRATLRDTLNRRDGIALEAGDAAFGTIRESADRYVLTATTVVDPAARPVAERPSRGSSGVSSLRGERPGQGGVRPDFQVNNQGGTLRGGVGIGNGRGGPGAGGRGDRPPGGPDGPPPGEGPPMEVLHGDARVAAVVPGSAQP